MALTDVDRRLLQDCLHEAPGAWNRFVDRFIGLFLHVIHHTSHSRTVKLNADDIDDLCSEVFVTLLKNDFAVLRHFRGESSLASYLTVIARRIVVNEIAKRRKGEAMGHIHASSSAVAKAEANGAERSGVTRMIDVEEVQSMLDKLPKREAAVVRMYHLEGKTYREIGAALGVAENTVGPILSKAREHLRDVKRRA